MALALLCLCGPVVSAPEKIVDMKVAANKMVKAETILRSARLVVKVGQEVEPLAPVLRAIRQEVLRLGYFEDVEVSSAEVEGGVAVTITVRERVRVSKVIFEGNKVFSADDLMKLIRTKAGLLFDARIAKRDTQRIEEAYQQRGVLARVGNVGVDDAGQVTFTIQEVRVEAVRFKGLRVVTDQEARELFAVEAGASFRTEDVASATRALQSPGWFEHVEVRVSPGEKGAETGVIVEVSVTERPGIFPERVGVPAPDIDADKLRADISIIRLNLNYQATWQVNEYLIDLQEDLNEALGRLEEAAKSDNATPDDLYEYARALRAVDRKQEAATQFRTAAVAYRQLLEKTPENVDVLLRLGESLAATGEDAEAVELLRKAVRLAPDRWEPQTEFVQAARDHILAEFGKAMAAALASPSPADLKHAPAVRAVAELMPWERTRAAMLAALETSQEPDAIVLLGREAAANIAEALRLAPREPAVLRTCFSVMLGGFFTLAYAVGGSPDVWTAMGEEAEAFTKQLGDLTDTDPALALWSTFFHSFRAVLALAGGGGPAASEQQITAQLRTLGKRLTEITEKWPRVLRTSGSILGIVQFIAGEHKLAKATFERAIEQNPYDRQNYNALLGLAFDEEDWAGMERVVRRRIEFQEAAEDHVLLGKIADRQDKPQEALAHFRETIERFPDDALGYVATAGWLLHLGGNDAEAEGLLDKGLAIDPTNAYGHAVRCALRLLQDKPEEAAAALSAALKAQPDEELANVLRSGYFTAGDRE